MCVCLCTYVCECVCLCTYVCVSVCVYVCTYVCVKCVFMYVRVCECVCYVRTCVCVRMYVRVWLMCVSCGIPFNTSGRHGVASDSRVGGYTQRQRKGKEEHAGSASCKERGRHHGQQLSTPTARVNQTEEQTFLPINQLPHSPASHSQSAGKGRKSQAQGQKGGGRVGERRLV